MIFHNIMQQKVFRTVVLNTGGVIYRLPAEIIKLSENKSLYHMFKLLIVVGLLRK
ncbi:Protein of unknown function [Bacillus mycoides]|nr:Protein of unknown function [Bacillus mycoides]